MEPQKPNNTNNTIISKESSRAATNLYSGGGSTLVMVIGKSGRGKTHSIGTLNPDTTVIISVIGKRLPFMNARRYEQSGHLIIESNADTIRRKMKDVAANPAIRALVIDDVQYIMATEFMDKAMVKGFDKWNIMARNIWEILILATKLRSDLTVYILTHEEDDGNYRRMKTLGKLLEDKITPEGLSTIVLFAESGGTKDAPRYYFATQTDGNTTAKSPAGMFPPQIPNSLALVEARVDEYYSGVELKNSKVKMEI